MESLHLSTRFEPPTEGFTHPLPSSGSIVFVFCSPMILFAIMARRPQPTDEVLSRKDLAELQRRLSMMSVTAVQDFYQYTHSACRIFPAISRAPGRSRS
jgi:hypothetical protein